MLLQQNNASLLIENNLSNSIIGTCIASNHLNLFIAFLQQSVDIDLGKVHHLPITDTPSESTEVDTSTANLFSRPSLSAKLRGGNRSSTKQKQVKSSKKNDKNIWKWKCMEIKNPKEYNQYSLIYLIIERDWQGALALILNEVDRFHLNYMQIIEAAILNNKLNLVLRLLSSLKDKITFDKTNSHQQNLFHLIANMNEFNETLLKQILLFLHEYDFNWNTPDKYGSYPIHYACVKQNFLFLDFLREKYLTEFNLNQTDAFGNTAVCLLFWSIAHKTTFSNEQLRLLIPLGERLDRLCNYDNETAINPLSFGYIHSVTEDIPYPPIKSNQIRTSPLIHAIVHNNFLLVKFLLERDVDVNYPDENEQTPLMHAVRQVNKI
jgi:ankyrin repeat protein